MKRQVRQSQERHDESGGLEDPRHCCACKHEAAGGTGGVDALRHYRHVARKHYADKAQPQPVAGNGNHDF